MTRFRRAVLTATATALALGGVADAVRGQGQAAGQTQAPVFRGGVNYVLVDAYPRRAGQIVEGLTAQDFQIFEDGKPQAIDAIEFVRVENRQADSAYRDPNTLREMNEAAADPRSRVFVLYLDTVHSTADGSNRIRLPLIHALNNMLSPRDLFGVMTPDLRPSDLTLQRRTLSVEDQLSRFWTWGRDRRVDSDPRDPVEDSLTQCFDLLRKPPPPGGALPVPVPWLVDDDGARRTLDKVLIDRRREDRVLASLADLVVNLGMRREARTVLIVLTDGWHLFPPNRTYENEPPRDWRFGGVSRNPLMGLLPGATSLPAAVGDADFGTCVQELNRLVTLDNERRLRGIIAAAQRSNVSIYPVSTAGLETLTEQVNEPQADARRTVAGGARLQVMARHRDRMAALQTLAENTDGRAIIQTNDLEGGMQRVVEDVSAYYLIGYYTTNAKADGRYRKIDVKTTRKDIEVRARRGYLAPSENARAVSAAVSAAASAPAGPSPVDEALGLLARSRASADVYVHGVAMADTLEVAVELGERQMASGDWALGAAVTVDAVASAGTSPAAVSGTIAAGVRGTRLSIPTAGSTGPWRITARVSAPAASLSERTEVRAVGRGLLGEGLLFRATPSLRSPLVPVAGFEFRRNERAHVEWVVQRSLDERTARLLDRRGQPLPVGVALSERESDGANRVVADVLLSSLAAGDYVMEVTATSGSTRERQLVAIRVMP